MFLNRSPAELIAKHKQAGFRWNGSTITVKARIGARHLFLATEEHLYVDGQPIAETGGFKIWSTGVGEFIDSQGTKHQIEYETGGLFFSWIPCTVSIDGEIVYKGAAPVRGIVFSIILQLTLLILLINFLRVWLLWIG